MIIKLFLFKVKAKLWYYIVSYTRDKSVYPYIYQSFWHYLFNKKNKITKKESFYYGARPNPGAGIGHQMANWIAGYWFAKQFGLKFAHFPFTQNSWEQFLGFGDNEITAKKLVEEQGYKKVLLPLFHEFNSKEATLIKNIIASYSNKRVVFVAEQDQFYRDQFGVIDEIKDKFYKTKARDKDKLIYSKDNFNIAIHVRRGDIVEGQINHNQNLLMRWQTNDYFKTALSTIIENLKPIKPIAIYLFSQGNRKDFADFEEFENIHFCLDMSAQDSFLHMVYADLLITSKSSFSYKPALLNNGTKVCPKDFWHGYPETSDWILTNEDGLLESEVVDNFIKNGLVIDSSK
ncbi:MAG: hypothetical protein P4L34_01055 [Paludibacter sp.]|nr:hypothetical protein [Paludibacter sp.]